MRRLAFLAALLLLASPSVAKDDPHAPARAARDRICALLEPLAEEARARHDRIAAQAIAETYLWVAGVPHPQLDAVRREVAERPLPKVAYEEPDDDALAAAWVKVVPHADALSKSTRDWDVLDAQLVRQLPDAVRAMRVLNEARIACGLKPARYDAKRSVKNIAFARETLKKGPALAGPVPHPRWDIEPWKPELAARKLLEKFDVREYVLRPADKGITIGTWARTKRRPWAVLPGVKDPKPLLLHATCIGPSGNESPLTKIPAAIPWPPPNGLVAGRQHISVPPGSDILPPPLPPAITLHGYGKPPPGAPFTARLLRGTKLVTSRHEWTRRGDLWRLLLVPPQVLPDKTAYTVEVLRKDGSVFRRWTFRTR